MQDKQQVNVWFSNFLDYRRVQGALIAKISGKCSVLSKHLPLEFFEGWCIGAAFFHSTSKTKVKFHCWYTDCCIQMVINDLGIHFSGKDKTWFFCPLEKKVLSDQKIYSSHVLVIHRDNSWAWRLQFIFRFLYLSANIFHIYKMTGLRLQHDGSVVHPYLLNFYMILSAFRDDMCLWFRLTIAIP